MNVSPNSKIILTLTLVISGLIPNESEAARVCRQKITLPAPTVGTCDIDTRNPMMGNPFAYLDPTQGCDFSFSLPGLPSFSLDGLKGALCNQIQDIGQKGINEALGPILDKIPSSVNLDMNDMMRGMFQDQMHIQKEFCPVYDKKGKLLSYECNPGGYVPPKPHDPVDLDKDHGGKNCYIEDGVKYCYFDQPDTKPEPEPDLPYCDELTDFYDENGNLVNCQVRQSSTSSSNHQSQSTSKPAASGKSAADWNTKSGW